MDFSLPGWFYGSLFTQEGSGKLGGKPKYHANGDVPQGRGQKTMSVKFCMPPLLWRVTRGLFNRLTALELLETSFSHFVGDVKTLNFYWQTPKKFSGKPLFFSAGGLPVKIIS